MLCCHDGGTQHVQVTLSVTRPFDASKLTSISLLERLKSAGPDDPLWTKLHDIYHPWIIHWLKRVPELGDEANDLAQDVLLVVVKELPRFNRQRDGSFRRWLGNVLVHRLQSHWKKRKRRRLAGLDGKSGAAFVEELEDPTSALSRQWDREHDQFVLDRLMTTVRADFKPSTWDAFRRCTLGGEAAAAVAGDLGISVNAVLTAKSRVLRRLREEAAGLID
jgi:RNA polymerase sigma-70 factor (ECF subfamily)